MALVSDLRNPSGFEGGVAGLDLSDLIQLNATNRFSGCFRVHCGARTGLIFFRDGDVVHAELGDRAGEEAFREILGWTRGTFDAEPNVVPARRTIEKTCEHLLLEAHRVNDERRARGEAASDAAAPAGRGSTVEVVGALPGVSAAVILTRDGQRVADHGADGERLAGETSYVALMGEEFGALFGAGEVRAATVQASRHHVLLYSTRSHYLGVAAEPERDPAAVDAAIRGALAKAR